MANKVAELSTSRKGSVGAGPAAVAVLQGHTGLITALFLNNKGDLLYSGSTDTTIKGLIRDQSFQKCNTLCSKTMKIILFN